MSANPPCDRRLLRPGAPPSPRSLVSRVPTSSLTLATTALRVADLDAAFGNAPDRRVDPVTRRGRGNHRDGQHDQGSRSTIHCFHLTTCFSCEQVTAPFSARITATALSGICRHRAAEIRHDAAHETAPDADRSPSPYRPTSHFPRAGDRRSATARRLAPVSPSPGPVRRRSNSRSTRAFASSVVYPADGISAASRAPSRAEFVTTSYS